MESVYSIEQCDVISTNNITLHDAAYAFYYFHHRYLLVFNLNPDITFCNTVWTYVIAYRNCTHLHSEFEKIFETIRNANVDGTRMRFLILVPSTLPNSIHYYPMLLLFNTSLLTSLPFSVTPIDTHYVSWITSWITSSSPFSVYWQFCIWFYLVS